MAFMPPFAPIVVLLFLGSIAATMMAAGVFVYGAVRRLPAARRWGGIGTLAVPAAYGLALVGGGLGSRDQVLPLGGRKYFCEIDCHIACSVERVQRVPDPARHRTFVIISLKTWFDESTTSPARPKDAPLAPNPREVYLADASGRRYPPWPEGLPGLSRPLIPGESHLTRLMFQVPEGARDPKLFVGDADPVSSLLLFHEKGPFHRKVWFGL